MVKAHASFSYEPTGYPKNRIMSRAKQEQTSMIAVKLFDEKKRVSVNCS